MTKVFLPYYFFTELLMYATPLFLNMLIVLKTHLRWISSYLNYKFKKNKVNNTKYFNLFVLKQTLLVAIFFELTNKIWFVLDIFHLSPILVINTIIIMSFLNNSHITNNYFSFNYFLLLPTIFFLKLLVATTNILVLLVLIELINYMFYFQFLNFFDKVNSDSKNKQFDAILIYFWSTFISLIIILVWLIFQLQEFNTLNFLELNLLFNNTFNNKGLNTVFFLGIFIKFGAVGLHLLKAEVYKLLRIDSVLLFSVITLFLYMQILYIFLDNFSIVYNFYKILIYTLLLFLSTLVMFVLANTNIFNILALSSVVNMTIILLINLN